MSLIIFLSIGTAAMLFMGLLRKRKYNFSTMKTVIVTLCLTVTGVWGTRILFKIESGAWGGQSYFGAVLFVPLLFAALAPVLRISYGRLMDFCAPAECAMLAIMKIDCVLSGCCSGRVLFYTEQGQAICFPSQLIEAVNAIVVMSLLLWLEHTGKHQNRGYSWYLLLYGGTRFALNTLRSELKSFVWILPSGHFWALLCVIAGAAGLLLIPVGKDTAVEKM